MQRAAWKAQHPQTPTKYKALTRQQSTRHGQKRKFICTCRSPRRTCCPVCPPRRACSAAVCEFRHQQGNCFDYLHGGEAGLLGEALMPAVENKFGGVETDIVWGEGQSGKSHTATHGGIMHKGKGPQPGLNGDKVTPARVRGPMGWPQPSFIAVSMSSLVASPRSNIRMHSPAQILVFTKERTQLTH